MDRRLTVHAGSPGQVAAVALVLGLAVLARPVEAAPQKPEARAAFDRGVKAYQDGDYAAASAALDESFAIEQDPETLFAWAQAERKLEHCDRAVALWEKLGGFDLPEANQTAIKQKIAECNEILAKQKPVEETKPVEPEVVSPPIEPAKPDEPPVEHPSGPRSRWKNPVGLSLLGLGAVGLGVGTVFLIQARSADSAKDNAATYDEFIDQRDKAKSKGRIGVIGLAAGGALVGAGLAWIMTRPSGEHAPISAWITGDGGGVVVTGGF